MIIFPAIRWRAIALIAFGVVLVGFLIGASDSFQACLTRGLNGNAGRRAEDGFVFFRSLIVSPRCFWSFLREDSGAVIGIATIALFVATYRLWRATLTLATDTNAAAAKQAKLTRRAIKLSQREFIGSNRPRLRVRREYFHDPGGNGGPAIPSAIYFTILNTGDSTAIVTLITTTHRIHPKAERLPPFVMPIDHHKLKSPVRIKPGGWYETYYEMDDLQRRRFISNYEGIADTNDCWFIGDITFEDENNIPRRIGFCRKYDSRSKCFDLVHDRNFEYDEG